MHEPLQNKNIDDLADRIADRIEDRLRERSQNTKKDRYLSRRQLAELLDVDLATIYRWSKDGQLPSYRLGGRVYYKEADLEAKMQRVPNRKEGRA